MKGKFTKIMAACNPSFLHSKGKRYPQKLIKLIMRLPMLYRVVFAVVLLVCLCGATAAAQFSAERLALNNLEKGKYLRARSQIARIVAREPGSVAAQYLLARFYFAPANPYFHIDSAHQHCQAGLALLAQAQGKVRERLDRLAVDSASFADLHRKIDSAAFVRAKALHTEAAYQYFIDNYPHARQLSQAIELRDEVAYLDALRENTWQSFRQFLDKYPLSQRAADAQSRYHKLLFEAKTSDQRLDSYRKFVEEHPESPYRAEAEAQILQISTARCSRQALLQFIETYPQSPHHRQALNLLYHLLKETDERLPAHLLTDSLKAVVELEAQRLVPFFKNGSFGWINTSGKECIAPAVHQLPEEYRCSYAEDDVLLADGMLLARNGTILATQVTEVDDLGFGFLLVTQADCRYVLHKSGKRITPCVEDARIVCSSMLAIRNTAGWSLLSFTGRMLIGLAADFYDLGPALGIYQNRQTELIRLDDIALLAEGRQPAVKFVADEARKMPQGIWVRIGNRQGVLDAALRPLIPVDEQRIEPLPTGFLVCKPTGCAIYQPGGRATPLALAAKVQYPWMALRQPQGWQVYFKNLAQPVNKTFDSLYFNGPIAIATRADSTHVLISHQVQMRFAGNPQVWFRPGKDSVFFLQVDLPAGPAVYNMQGQMLFTTDAQQVVYAGEGYFEGTKAGKKGLLAPNGKWVVPPEFDALGSAQQGLVSTLRNARFGMWNVTQQKEIKTEYDKNLLACNAQLLVATRQGTVGMITWDGKPVVPFQYDEIICWNDSVVLARKNFQWMFLNWRAQKIILDHIQWFTWIEHTDAAKTLIFQRDGYYGVADNRKGILLQPSFTRIINLGNTGTPFYFTEKYIEEAGIYVVIYYNHEGKLVYRQVLEEDEYEQLSCSR